MISNAYRTLVDALKARNGLPSPFRSEAPVDANDRDAPANDEEAAELLRRTIREINGEEAEKDGSGDGAVDDEDEFASLGALSLPVRRMMAAHAKAKEAEQPVDPAHATAVAAAVDLIRTAGRRHFK